MSEENKDGENMDLNRERASTNVERKLQMKV
jgi:hypothetical protein